MKSIEKLQTLLPLGYLYLVIVGIIKETVLFSQLGINILRYSSIMDVLISPIATFTSNFVLIFAIGFIFLLSYYMPSFLKKNGHKKWVIKTFELNKKADNLTDAETDDYYLFVSFKSLAFGLLSVYLGYGMAEGHFISERIKENRLHFDYKLNYNSGEIVDICLIETNSQFCFYVEKGMKTVKIAPISSIKNLELNDIKLFKSTK